MFSKTCEYALRAVIYIAQQSKQNQKVSFKQIAKAIDAPESFIARILQDLSRRDVIQSAKGPTGGFFVNQQSMNQSLADVVRVMDGDKLFVDCGLGLSYCSEKNPCPLHNEFKAIRANIQQMLESATLGNFNDLLDQQQLFLGRS
ncbi:RrF2 family transcriptional regulator [Fibrella aquatilis]|uniref:Rrf2 family transcriptional regulator n=1 Tax=Fibrella aquatilis TaxID=2817059 RepID=A0A939JY01_9BACT|nr:Rrf2 family transcriptional regulator [Fibrella aquatilis]MBO0929366.1 Rrf2 family transcriptional regulator [Fibrella aquatilis]